MHRDEPRHEDELRALGLGDLVVELGRLLELAVLAIPTCLGVSLIFGRRAPATTLSALRPGWHREPVLASLAVRLPRPPIAPSLDRGTELVIYAGAPRAFVETTPSLLALLDTTSRRITADAHLELPDLAQERAAREQWLNDQTVIDRAFGILLDRGLLPADGHVELARLAAVGGTSELEVARALIASATSGLDPA